MPKQKTRKAAAKRFRFTASGKIMRRGAKMRHLLECKSPGQRRRMSKDRIVSHTDAHRVRVMMPNG